MEIEEPEEEGRLPPIATPNLSMDYQEHVRMVLAIKENRTLKGRIYYCAYLAWDVFGNMTPFLMIVVSVLTCVAAFTRSMMIEKDLFKAATYAGFFGIGVGSLLVLIDMLTFWFGAFTDLRTKYRIRNYWHRGYFFLVAVILVVLGLSIYALIRLFTMQEEKSKDYSFSHIFLN